MLTITGCGTPWSVNVETLSINVRWFHRHVVYSIYKMFSKSTQIHSKSTTELNFSHMLKSSKSVKFAEVRGHQKCPYTHTHTHLLPGPVKRTVMSRFRACIRCVLHSRWIQTGLNVVGSQKYDSLAFGGLQQRIVEALLCRSVKRVRTCCTTGTRTISAVLPMPVLTVVYFVERRQLNQHQADQWSHRTDDLRRNERADRSH